MLQVLVSVSFLNVLLVDLYMHT